MSAFRSSLRPFLRAVPRAPLTAPRPFSSSASRSLAHISLTGNLAAEPELSTRADGKEVITYSVGTNHGPKDNRRVSWYKVNHWLPTDSQREFLLSIPKGSRVYVHGDVTYTKYEASDGSTQRSLNVRQRHLEVLRRGNEASSDETSEPSSE